MNPAPAAVRGDSVSLDIYGSAQAQSPAHLTSYFVKPQFLFGIPPACNVFFPSQITQLGYEENYATQPTRMYFNDDSWTQFLNSRTNTPALQTAVRTALTVAHPEEVNLVLQHSLNDPKYNGKNLLVYPEEFYRGPVIDRRVMPRWFLFLKKAQDQGGTTNVETLSEDEQIDLLREVLPGDSARNIYRKYAAYEYAKERYSRRNGGIQMPFNPYPIAGFPCAVMDRRSTEVDVFGYVMNVQHTLSTRAMTTHVSFSYGRTFQEAFALLKKQVDLENLVINRERAAIARKINETGTPYDLRENMERVGPIAVAPAEPIREIRDVIQNFDRAEAFYQALLYRAQPPSADELTQQQEQAEIVRRADAEENFVIAPAALSTISETEVDQYLRNKDASFQYHKIIQLQKLSGKKEDIKITGIDSTTRIKLISIIDKMREGTATDSELTLIRNALVQPDLAQQGEVQDATLDQRLNVIEEEIQNTLTSTNITGDVSITPKQSARRLFSSYSSALFYNARPICTLDEYLLFLGESADPQGKTTPQTALANNASRTFPATFYERIRTYRPGPPADLPTTNISNTSVYTSPDGVYVVDLTSQDLEPVPATDGSENNVAGIPEDFPETSQDWDAVLLVYRNNVLNREPPGR